MSKQIAKAAALDIYRRVTRQRPPEGCEDKAAEEVIRCANAESIDQASRRLEDAGWSWPTESALRIWAALERPWSSPGWTKTRCEHRSSIQPGAQCTLDEDHPSPYDEHQFPTLGGGKGSILLETDHWVPNGWCWDDITKEVHHLVSRFYEKEGHLIIAFEFHPGKRPDR